MSGDIHTCSYQCDRPACIRAQRDELVAKLDAVTKDARWLLDLIDENEGRTAYSLRAQHMMADIESRLTDQGRAGEGRGG